jgi:pyrimidine operon attenuation protein/uracil phosphoribosyltransferase
LLKVTDGGKVKIKSKIFDEAGMNRVIVRMVHEITEKNKGVDRMALIGMRTRGEFLARRIGDKIKELEGTELPIGILDVSFYRDDTRAKLKQPVVQSTDIPFDLNEKKIILIDDVLYTGRSVRAALDEIMDFGRPDKVELAVLIDRGHRELPIQPNYVGKSVTTFMNEEIRVRMKEQDEVDEVLLVETH